MIRTLSLIKRRPDITRDAFREHYETVHAPLQHRRAARRLESSHPTISYMRATFAGRSFYCQSGLLLWGIS